MHMSNARLIEPRQARADRLPRRRRHFRRGDTGHVADRVDDLAIAGAAAKDTAQGVLDRAFIGGGVLL